MASLEDKLNSVTGEGSALAYLVGYLKRMLPGLTSDIKTWCEEYGISYTHTSGKFYIIVIRELGGIYPESLCDIDVSLVPGNTFLEDVRAARAGDQSRKLTKSMYQIEDKEDGNEYYICAELAGPVKTLRGIFDLVGSEQSLDQFKDEEDNFVTTLNQLASMKVTQQYAEKFEVVDLNSEADLPKVLLQRIKDEISKR